ncbi:hypothetical protein CFC21_091990 [Triticum aestivum]|uniref:Phytocyanin domain-containing protein n=4 Tax=Triticinae TaxID=1648030 RepID=A0A453NFJ0_AEGTS|nr:early nodulin-like protein 2 [Aegilops tauschii subsp. strangulata]XP_044418875.1 early nodulin-like protein 2 [Triticum aestivum]KAF7088921.1 hypothetical protein CFC21_091990 [Triticum aestivum]
MAKGAGYGLGFACFALVAAMAGAAQFKVGGDSGWSVAGASKESYNTWAMKNRFQVGDTLVFVYPKDKDSVLVVQPADYNACNTSSYDKKFADGNTVFALDHAGAFFFVSGVEANCRANEKLIVMVLAGRNGTGTAAAPPPSSPAAPAPATSSPPPAASSPPPATPPSPLPAAPAPSAPSPTSAPPPASASAPPPASSPASAPPTSSPTAPASPPLPTPSAPTGAPPMAPSANAPAGADGGSTNSTGTSSSPPPAGSNEQNGATLTVTGAAGLAGSAAACIVGYAMLAL